MSKINFSCRNNRQFLFSKVYKYVRGVHHLEQVCRINDRKMFVRKAIVMEARQFWNYKMIGMEIKEQNSYLYVSVRK